MPSLRAAKESANSAICMSNLRQLYNACAQYAGEHDGGVPPFYDSGRTISGDGFPWPYLLMPYLGYQGTAQQYYSDTYHHANLEIRSGWTYKTLLNTTTKSSSVWFCPSTRGAFTDPTGSSASSYFIDYSINQNTGGYVNGSGNYDESSWGYIQHLTFGSSPATSPTKLIFMGDAGGGWFCNLSSKSSSRHYVKGFDTSVGRINIIFFDGHAESCPHLVTGTPTGRYCYDNEQRKPGWQYYFYGGYVP